MGETGAQKVIGAIGPGLDILKSTNGTLGQRENLALRLDRTVLFLYVAKCLERHVHSM